MASAVDLPSIRGTESRSTFGVDGGGPYDSLDASFVRGKSIESGSARSDSSRRVIMFPRMARHSLVAAVVLAILAASCEGDTGPAGPEGPSGPAGPAGPQGPQGPPAPALVEVFTATLSGAEEVPPNDSEGTGSAVLTAVGGQLVFRVDVGNVLGVTRAHIHGPAGVGVNAGILVNLYEPPAGTEPLDFPAMGTLAQGVAGSPLGVSSDSLLVLLRNGNAYVNVHTTTFPPGELRGQITPVP